ncbi:MAG TPA: stage III sporulation protein AG [Candidatus Paenibacillus intestinavium]|nr:stage III sporulation protein AG [Candidatus Paenibacillus intestinavium]
MVKWLKFIEKWFGGGPGGEKRVKVIQGLVIVGAIGIFLMLINSFFSLEKIDTGDQQPPTVSATEEVFRNGDTAASSFATVEGPLEERLKEILEKMVGVGKVSVMVTVESTEEKVVERNLSTSESSTEENDRNGGTRHITTVTSDGQVVLYQASGGQQPLITKIINPRIRGVLIVAEGAEDAAVRKLIIQAVEKGMNVVPTRISVVPSKK